MTVDPTALQTARLHVGQIRVCWPLLAEARTARVSRGSVALSGRAAAMRDDDLRAERADREAAVSYVALAASPAPANLRVLDVRTDVLQAVHASLLLARSDAGPWLGRRGVAIHGQPPRHVTDHTITAAMAWLADYIEHAGGATPAAIAAELAPAIRRAQRILDIDPDDDWRPMGTTRCPACRQRALSLWTAGTDRRAWTRECRGQRDDGEPCRCTGDGCPCGRAGARPGSRHLWPA